MNEKEKKLIEVVAEVLDVDSETLTLKTKREDLEEWDSLAMVELVGEIESSFECRIPFDEIDNCKSIEDFLKYI